MYKYKLTLAYDGTNYSGWQVQPHATSIQEILEKAIHTITREQVRLIGSGRTDAGVHAMGQVAHCVFEKPIDLEMFFKAMNGILPYDIRLLDIVLAPLDFHAQKSARRKVYHYHLCLQPVVLPFQRLYTSHVREPLCLDLMLRAAQCFVGTHNFTSFANSASEGAAAKNAERTLYRLDLIKTEQGLRLEFEGNGFLYKMVRNIVGMLLEVGGKKRALDDISRLFTAKDRRLAPKAAPARGLFLMEVCYE